MNGMEGKEKSAVGGKAIQKTPMARHSHFHNIMLKKGAADKKRAKAFTRHARLIAVAAQKGGSGDPDGNPLLRMAIESARLDNVPKDNIDRAIKKGTGADKEGIQISEALYEIRGPGGTGILISVLTDNKNRTLGDIKKILLDFDAHMADSGAISWMFEQKGEILLMGSGNEEEDGLKCIDAGAEDFEKGDEGALFVYTKPSQLGEVRKNLEGAGFKIQSAQLTFIPKNTVSVENKETAKKLVELMEALDEQEDVEKVVGNFDIPPDLL